MCNAPQLITHPAVLPMQSWHPTDLTSKLLRWQSEPESAPAWLHARAHYRLGIYFEDLYAGLVSELLGWRLLARNVAVRQKGHTFGELDFVVQNPSSGLVEHHEIAVKFYLAVQTAEGLSWHGPNPADRLDIKVSRLLSHQLALSDRPDTIATLSRLGIAAPAAKRLFMPGYLFYPRRLDSQSNVPIPDMPAKFVLPPEADIASDHLSGSWSYANEISDTECRHWVPLNKPHWLGDWQQEAEADPALAADSVQAVELSGKPRLFARLARQPDSAMWTEVERIFVVPSFWPGTQDSSRTTLST